MWLDPQGLTVRYKINDGLTPIQGGRNTAIDRVWVQEKALLNQKLEGTRAWSDTEKNLIKETPNKNLTSVMSKAGYTGHHINSVEGNGKLGALWQGDPRNIVFLQNHNHPSGVNEHVHGNQGHRGNTKNSTKGRLIDRSATLKTSAGGC
ncbi:hypothetical protein [Pseudomonas syringae]|nr:hypothetical protein [Pseudomonas syringae]